MIHLPAFALKRLTGALAALVLCATGAFADEPIQFKIASQPLVDALKEFAQQADMQLLYKYDVVEKMSANAVIGRYDKREALRQLLKGTGLEIVYLSKNAATIGTVAAPKRSGASVAETMRLAQVAVAANSSVGEQGGQPPAESTADPEAEKGIPEILVKADRHKGLSLNADIRRTEDDVQPYVVFDAEEIEMSMATTLDEFLRMNLPMNATEGTPGQNVAGTFGDYSSISLRGLGSDETLILVNGRRMPGFSFGSSAPGQADINGIPVSAVARIEVLPSTAGGIYGGGATGGVINIILRDDYTGLQADYKYTNTFDTDTAHQVYGLSGGLGLLGGRTRVSFTLNRASNNAMFLRDRDFLQRSRALTLQNNPGSFYNSTTPPTGATTNIRSVSGQPLVLKEGSISLGSPIAHVPVGYAGPSTDKGIAFLDTAGTYNLDIPVGLAGEERSLATTPVQRQGVTLGVRHKFTEKFELFLDGSYNESESVTRISRFPTTPITLQPTASNNPFTQAIRVTFPAPDFDYGAEQLQTSSTLSATVGAIARLPRNWNVQGEFHLGESTRDPQSSARTTVSTITTALANGTLDVMRDTAAHPLDYSPYYFRPVPNEYFLEPYATGTRTSTLRTAGPLFNTGAGPVKLAGKFERRRMQMEESLRATSTAVVDDVRYAYQPARKQYTDTYYVELTAPLFAHIRGVRALDLQLSYRNDTTEAVSTVTSAQASFILPSPDAPRPEAQYRRSQITADQYTVGFRYQPVESLTFRVSYGAGVLPPNITQLTPTVLEENTPSNTFDPKRNNQPIGLLSVYSQLGYPGLLPEESSSWSAGLIFKPRALPGLRASVDYTRIEKINEIELLIGAQGILDYEDYFPHRVVRNPLTEEDQLAGFTVGTVRELHTGYVNFARTKVEAYDFNLGYTWNLPRGVLRASTLATWQPHLMEQPNEESPSMDTAGHYRTPKWRGAVSLGWEQNGWRAAWNMQYTDSYLVYLASASESSRLNSIISQGSPKIERQLYHDLSVRYRFDADVGRLRGWLANTELLAGIANVFNTSPPIVATSSVAIGTQGYSGFGSPLMRRYTLSIRKSFD